MSPRKRRRGSEDEALFMAVGVLAVVGLVLVKVVQWVWVHWWVLVVAGLLALLGLAGLVYRRILADTGGWSVRGPHSCARTGWCTRSAGWTRCTTARSSRRCATCSPAMDHVTWCAAAAGATSART
ncbi:hypothetical protein [Streptomyces sp. NPDC046821]|uniref:hypothetical protein n=1 Tax=Streptomyces sp. NPDC046821 TaxID=3154702 RepID=UPI003408DD4B